MVLAVAGDGGGAACQDGPAELQAAIQEALERDVPHPNAVRLALDRRRTERGEPPPVALVLPEHLRARDRAVPPQPLAPYDQLKDTNDECARALALRLYGLLARWAEVANQPWLPALLDHEEQERARRSLQRRLDAARIGRFKPICDFDWVSVR